MLPIDPCRASVFGQAAENYERWRPGYPLQAVDWLLPASAARVADLGAGTGKLTGPVLSRGVAVAAVEPDDAMLQVLRRCHPTAEPHLADAGSLPLPDRSLDAVVVGQAWHWFPHQAAVREIRRVLRAGGWLGLVWNVMSPSEPWEVELAGLDPDHQLDETEGGSAIPVPGLEGEFIETAAFPWTWEVSAAQWRAYLATQSAYAVMETPEREARLDASHALIAGFCELGGRTTAPIHHQSVCVRWLPQEARV